MDEQVIEWRKLKEAELHLKGNRLMAEVERLQKELGVVLRAVIEPLPNGMAQAKIVIELTEK